MECTVRYHKVKSIPSISSLSRFGDYREIGYDSQNTRLLEYLNRGFNNTGYFGSERDRYREAFGTTINHFLNRSFIAENDLRRSLGALSDIDDFRDCSTEESLRNIPPCMTEAITYGCRPLYELYNQNKVQGWFESTKEERIEGKKKWHRLLYQNGVSRYKEGDKDEVSTHRWMWKTGDPDLSFQQLDDIEATREYVEWILENTDIDPTDMDEIRS